MKLSDNEVWQKCKNRSRNWALKTFCRRLSEHEQGEARQCLQVEGRQAKLLQLRAPFGVTGVGARERQAPAVVDSCLLIFAPEPASICSMQPVMVEKKV